MLYACRLICLIRTLAALFWDPNPNRLAGGALRCCISCTHCSRVPWGSAGVGAGVGAVVAPMPLWVLLVLLLPAMPGLLLDG